MESPFFAPNSEIETTQAHLPHWHQNAKIQFLTFRLADSLPQEKLRELKEQKEIFERENPKPWDSATEKYFHQTFGSKIDEWLDQNSGSCILKFPKIRQIVNDTLLFFAGTRYHLHGFVIMPNHVHALIGLLGDFKTREILHSWKSFSAAKICNLLGMKNGLWQLESFDRIIRSPEHYYRVLRYIKENPKHLKNDEFTLYLNPQKY